MVRTEAQLRGLIVKACKALDNRQLVAGTDGNVSARLPSGNILVTPSGSPKGDISEDSILLCSDKGRRIRGSGVVSTEINLHLVAYRERPMVRAVVHAHPPVTSGFVFSGNEKIFAENILPEVAAQIGLIPTAPYLTPGTAALAEAAAPLLRAHDVVLLAQHGAVSLGADPWAAYLRMEKLEAAAVIYKAAWDLAGSSEGIKRLSAAQVADLLRYYKKP